MRLVQLGLRLGPRYRFLWPESMVANSPYGLVTQSWLVQKMHSSPHSIQSDSAELSGDSACSPRVRDVSIDPRLESGFVMGNLVTLDV